MANILLANVPDGLILYVIKALEPSSASVASRDRTGSFMTVLTRMRSSYCSERNCGGLLFTSRTVTVIGIELDKGGVPLSRACMVKYMGMWAV